MTHINHRWIQIIHSSSTLLHCGKSKSGCFTSYVRVAVFICSPVRTYILLCAAQHTPEYYAIRQPARTGCGAGVHTLQASSALFSIGNREWSERVRIQRKKQMMDFLCVPYNARRELPGLLWCAGNWEALTIGILKALAVRSQVKSIDFCYIYGLWHCPQAFNQKSALFSCQWALVILFVHLLQVERVVVGVLKSSGRLWFGVDFCALDF